MNIISVVGSKHYFNFFILIIGAILISADAFSMTRTGNEYEKLISGSSDMAGFVLVKNVSLPDILDSKTTDTISQQKSEEYLEKLERNQFLGGRTTHWYYAWLIFKDYPWHKKMFGGGFNYLEMFGKKFEENRYDYPHNPFISAFLYSGIIGGVVYLWFMVIVFIYYIRYLKHHLFFFICFLVVFFFSFVSGNTHFSVPVFAILSFIPFFTRYIVKKEQISDEQNGL